SGCSACPRSSPTAHRRKEPSGWTEIIHPFHPLRGRRFPILKARRVSGIDTFILQGTSGGTFCVPREWTDRGVPAAASDLPIGPHVLDFVKLIALTELLTALERADDRRLPK
ncbi:MAG: DUF5372 family protein, partial [Spirochaetaceae bacterium]|nr:DUF5372 family protein [Spirochaetaceae bacterium]